MNIDYVHLAFLAGIIIAFLYYRRYRVSAGGSLAAGYLASSLYAPLNVVATIAVSFAAFALIRGVILKIFLPRPRQIFAIGLAVGVVLNGVWLALGYYFVPESMGLASLQLVGVIVPGMLCNSLVKQGVRKTMVPLAMMVPLAAAVGAVATLLPNSPTNWLFAEVDTTAPSTAFALSAVSVLLALVIQESTVRNRKLRTAGYVTAGMLVTAASHPVAVVVIALTAAVITAAWVPYTRRVPLFGKDRFFILLMLSFLTTSVIEIALNQFTGVTFDGPQNIVMAVLPAIIVNDLVQYGIKRTATGFGLSVAGCSAVALSLAAVA